MTTETTRQWLDRYQEFLRPILNNYGFGCLYVSDISCASGITFCRAEKYNSRVGVLFQEDSFDVVVSEITKAVKDVLENHLGDDNRICFTILHGGLVTGGFGIWIIKEKSEFIEEILSSDKPYLVGMLV
jgi:hypothetical protein